MKREFWAGLLLLTLLAGSALNVRVTERIIATVELSLSRAERAIDRDDCALALKALDDARTVWQGSRSYAHVFLRHADVDSANDAFYELEGYLRQGDRDGASAALARLRYHLEMIEYMEKLSPGSVF